MMTVIRRQRRSERGEAMVLGSLRKFIGKCPQCNEFDEEREVCKSCVYKINALRELETAESIMVKVSRIKQTVKELKEIKAKFEKVIAE